VELITQNSSFSILKRYAASALSGVLLFACFPLLNRNGLVWVACAPLLVALASERSLGRAFGLGYVTGAVFLAGSCYWFIPVMENYGKLARPLAVGVWLLFAIVFAVFFGAFGLVVGLVRRRSVPQALMLSPFVWVAAELARTYLITGVPWNLLGYAVGADGLRQLASVTAVYGLSFLAVATSALTAAALLDARRKRLWFSLAGWFLLLAAANRFLAPPALAPGAASALLVQPNVPLDETVLEGWGPWHDRAPLDRLVGISLAGLEPLGSDSGPGAAPPLVVWAENPAPFYFDRDAVFRTAIENLARRGRAYVIASTVTFAGSDYALPKNSAVIVDPDGRLVAQYDKIHLVPFGEYVPWWAFPGHVGKITSQVGNFVPGAKYQIAEAPEGKIAVFICYEGIFPQLVRRLAAQGAGVLINISNDAWYGDTPAAFQHLEMERWRAVENGRYLLRATNDGITALIDPYGRIVAELPRHRMGALPARFRYLARRTFYTAYGDVFAWVCVVVAALGVTSAFGSARGNGGGSARADGKQ